MARIKYYYDEETCKHLPYRPTKRKIISRILLLFCGIFAVSFLLCVTFFRHFESPKEHALLKEKIQLEDDILNQQLQLNVINADLLLLGQRDDNQYRVIFGQDAIPASIRQAGFGGTQQYQDLINSSVDQQLLLISNAKLIDQLKKRMYVQTRSYDKIAELSKVKELKLAGKPAIQPISNKQLTRVSSLFGYRDDPFGAGRKKHEGIDLSARTGTPIYASGGGTIKLAKMTFGGYGKQVEINHGFGYVTKYAHMHKIKVKEGQKVKRGEIIGYVGSTGRSKAAHLHYEVIKNGGKVDPFHYIHSDLTQEAYDQILKNVTAEGHEFLD